MKELKPIEEHSYSYLDGFFLNRQHYKGGSRQIDWETVKEFIESKEYDTIEVGLAEDWACTKMIIFYNFKCATEENQSAGFYGSSSWATPAIKLTNKGGIKLFECWIMGENPNYPEWLSNN